MAKKSPRQEFIDIILNKKTSNNDPEQNIEFLESLSLIELQRLAEGNEDFADELDLSEMNEDYL